jgi:hypothetical protein
MDLGKVFNRFFLPVRQRLKKSQVCELSQAVACLVVGGQWQEPHMTRSPTRSCWKRPS